MKVRQRRHDKHAVAAQEFAIEETAATVKEHEGTISDLQFEIVCKDDTISGLRQRVDELQRRLEQCEADIAVLYLERCASRRWRH